MEIVLRRIEEKDMESVIDLLQQMSDFEPTKKYEDIWQEYVSQNNQFGIVADAGSAIVGYGTVLIQTNIRGGKMGHIEDIVVNESDRKKGLGKAIMETLNDIAAKNGCYKTALQCKEEKIEFYKACNYSVSGTAMQQFLAT